MTTAAARPIPALGRPRAGKIPTVADQMLPNGLRVLAVRRAGVPLVELRLRIPFAGPAGSGGEQYIARTQLLSDTMLFGTEQRSAAQIAIELQSLGAQLNVSTDPDRLGLNGSVLSSGLAGLLDLMADVLTSASYPKSDVGGERDRLVQSLAIARSQAGVVAQEALLRRMYGDHPYSRSLPTAEAIADVKAGQLRSLHAKRVAPAGSILTVVGDVQPARAIAQVERALAGWTTRAEASDTPAPPDPAHDRVLLVDRPGAVQSTIRWGRKAPSRSDPGFAALSLANLVFGGYFSSRWSANIREDKGYTYGAQSSIAHPLAGSRLMMGSDVATDVTAPAMLESWYEMARIATLPVTQDELDQARRYAIGSLQLGAASQGGLATLLSTLAASGLDVGYLRDYPAQLLAVTVDDALTAAAAYLRPQGLTTVVIGDASVIADPVSRLVEIERA